MVEFDITKKTILRPDHLDIEVARSHLSKYSDHIAMVQARVKDLKIKDEESKREMVEIVAQGKRLLVEIDDHRKLIIKNPDEFVRSVNRFVKGFKDQIAYVIDLGTAKLNDYAMMEHIEKEKEQKRIRDEQAKMEKEYKKAAEKAGVPAPEMPKAVVNKKIDPVRTESGSASVSLKWVAELVDESIVPREYLTVDFKKVNQAVKAGIREIAGFEIKQVADTRIRRS